MERRLFNTADAAHYLSVHPKTLQNMRLAKLIKGIRIGLEGGEWRYPKDELDAYINRMLKAEESC